MKNAILLYYQYNKGNEFQMWDFIKFVRNVSRKMGYDSTIKREMRMLRQNGKINYRIINRKLGIYQFI